MARRALAVLVAALAAPAGAAVAAAPDYGAIADEVERNVVWVHPRAGAQIDPGQAGRLRLRILDKDIGRIKIAVLPPSLAREAGGMPELANGIDRELGAAGALLVAAGDGLWAVTSWDEGGRVAAVLRRAAGRSDPYRRLAYAVDGIAAIDPQDNVLEQAQGGGAGPPGTPAIQVDDPSDEILGTFRLAALVVAAAIALPFLIGAFFVFRWFRARNADASEAVEDRRRAAHDRLMALGDDIRLLDLDATMPGADRAGVEAYNAAVASYDRADDALPQAATGRRVGLVEGWLGDGERQMQAAKRAFGRL